MKIEDLKQELYTHVSNQKLSEEEKVIIDGYIQSLLKTFSKVLEAQDKVLKDSSELEKFKNLVLENITEGE